MNLQHLQARFHANPTVNPETGKTIQIGKATYNNLAKKYGAPPAMVGTQIPTQIPTQMQMPTQVQMQMPMQQSKLGDLAQFSGQSHQINMGFAGITSQFLEQSRQLNTGFPGVTSQFPGQSHQVNVGFPGSTSQGPQISAQFPQVSLQQPAPPVNLLQFDTWSVPPVTVQQFGIPKLPPVGVQQTIPDIQMSRLPNTAEIPGAKFDNFSSVNHTQLSQGLSNISIDPTFVLLVFSTLEGAELYLIPRNDNTREMIEELFSIDNIYYDDILNKDIFDSERKRVSIIYDKFDNIYELERYRIKDRTRNLKGITDIVNIGDLAEDENFVHNITHNITQDTTQDTTQDIERDITQNIQQDTTEGTQNEIQENPQQDTTQGSQNEIQENIQQDITQGTDQNTIQGSQQDITQGANQVTTKIIKENAQKHTTQGIEDNSQLYTQEHITQRILENGEEDIK